jgi:hypothetical protein
MISTTPTRLWELFERKVANSTAAAFENAVLVSASDKLRNPKAQCSLMRGMQQRLILLGRRTIMHQLSSRCHFPFGQAPGDLQAKKLESRQMTGAMDGSSLPVVPV